MKRLTFLPVILGMLLFGALSGSALAGPAAALLTTCVHTGTLDDGNPQWMGACVSAPTATATTTSSPTATASATATNTAAPTATATATNTPTNTATGTGTATTAPSATNTATTAPTVTAAPSLTPTAGAPVGMQPVNPVILGTCTVAIHDRYFVVVAGIKYRTFHPQVVLIDPANPGAGTCAFNHEHGDDPTTSLANPSLPAFERVGQLAGFVEPHEGEKVFVQNKGTVNSDGRTALTSNRLVVHMGTSGAARFFTQFHSVMIDVVAPDGHYAHVQGMGDTGGVSSICAIPRAGKTEVDVPGTSACTATLTSLYSIWQTQFTVSGALGPIVTALAAPAVFDPISLHNPFDAPGVVVLYLSRNYAASYPTIFGQGRTFHGCKREGYVGPVYWANNSEQTVFTTDPYGHVLASGPLTQSVSIHLDGSGIPMSTDFGVTPVQTQMKLASNHCADGGPLGDNN